MLGAGRVVCIVILYCVSTEASNDRPGILSAMQNNRNSQKHTV